MSKKHATATGIIEGFFGRSWDWESRKNYAQFLALNAYNFYIYAPKSDKNLRLQWQQDWPAETKANLVSLRNHYRDHNIDFGIGLSPHEIYLNQHKNQRQQLKRRLQQLNELAPDILCILFDDMRGDIANLAQLQIDIAHEAAEICSAKRIIFCPTYYSFDPVLERVFGTMPKNYWQTFSNNLDKTIDMFWTGEKVCSTSYSATHLAQVSELIGRQPFLWDNYPVNDGAVKSNLLHLRAFDQSHSQLNGKIAGHAINPMNQPWLSQIPLASLPLAYKQQENYQPDVAFKKITHQLCGEKFAQQLMGDIELLQDRGLKKLSASEQHKLRQRYAQYPDNPYAQELLDWLDGGYTFDPACLTE